MSFTSEQKVEALTSVTISVSSVPTTAQLAVWIAEVEAVITEKSLGIHTATDQYLDVPERSNDEKIYNWEYSAKRDRLSINEGGVARIPLTNLKRPLISITSLAKNDENYSDAADWTTVTEGPGDGTDWLLRQSGSKQHGYEIIFYDNYPLPGPKRIKLTYVYGHNVDNNILSRWATLMASIPVLQARMGTNSIDGLAYTDAGDWGVAFNTNYLDRIEEYRKEIAKIEKEFFPPSGAKAGAVYITL